MRRPPDDAGNTESHVPIEDLAMLAEGHPATPEIVAHLSGCRTCMAAYADAVRYRGAWLAFPEQFGATPPPVEARDVRDPRKKSPFEIPAWFGATAMLAIAVGLFALGPWRPARSPVTPPAIQRLLVQASASGLVFPGGEAGAAGESPAYRANPRITEETGAALEAVRERVESGEKSIDPIYALAAGLIATGRIDLADDYVDEVRERAPQDARFIVLASMVSLQRGEPAQAESLLRHAKALAPRDATVALDLGLVLHETGGLSAARPFLIEATQRAPGSPIARRARQLLGSGSSR
jgi:tetratricopeptide (TPR) repeat protein